MSTVNDGNLTLADWLKVRAPDGGILQAVQLLARRSRVIDDAAVMEGNLPTGHRVALERALPTPEWRMFNQGYTASKGRVDTVDESCGMFGTRSVVDVALAELNGDAGAYRMQQDMMAVAALKNEAETAVFYHSTLATPEKIMGLAPRLNSTSGTYGSQIVLADATASGNDQTSIWLVGWAPRKVYLIFPKGSMAGLQKHDMAIQSKDDGSSSNKSFRAFETYWEWKLGLAVEDARYLVRVANVDTGNLAATGSLIIEALIRAKNKMEDLESVRPVIYMNRTVNTHLELQARDALKNSGLNYSNVGGQPVATFQGIPIHITDALLNTEAPIT
jgi:hypothetical protein